MTDTFLAPVDFTRDRWGRPLIIQADSAKPVAYTRVSGFGSNLENQFGLNKWKQRIALIGAINRPDLIAVASASRADDRKLDSIVDDLLEAGGVSQAANTGTAIHGALAQLDEGITTIDDVHENFRGYADAWLQALDRHGLEVVPDLVELQLVNDEFQAAGSGDNFLRRKSDGKLVAVDKKTGKSISPRPIAYMVQLYLYATAMRYDVNTGARTEIGDVDMTVAYIAHIPAIGDTCVFYEVDLTAARELTLLAAQVRDAEKKTPKVSVLAPKPADDIDVRRLWIRNRLASLAENYPDARESLGLHWPMGLPGFKSGHEHTDAEIDIIARLLDLIEADNHVPFGATDPKVAARNAQNAVDEQLFVSAFPTATPVEDTSEIDQETYQALKEVIEALPNANREWVNERTTESAKAKKSVSLRQKRTRSRYEIVRVMVDLSHFHAANDIVTLLIDTAMNSRLIGSPVGARLGSMTTVEVARAKQLIDAVNDGSITLGWDADQAPVLEGDIEAHLDVSSITKGKPQ
jgi:hypothetical protein